MKITEIYKKYNIPKNLQEHMFRVAAVGKMIVDNFREPIEGEVVIKTLLLHDMGNIIKFKFKDPSLLDKKDFDNLDELKKIQGKFIDRYGNDCDEATLKIIKEITDDKRIYDLCATSHSNSAHEFVQTDEWEKKFSFYCDMRVGPFHVLPVNKRFDDLEERYAGKDPEKILTLRRYRNECLLIQEQIQNETLIDIEEINEEMVEEEIKELKTWEI